MRFNLKSENVFMKAKVEKQLCHCKGQHVNCLDCNGTGMVENSPTPIDEGKWYLNIHIPQYLRQIR
jgi:hypothetical protein